MTYRALFALREFRALFASSALSVAALMMEMLALSALVYASTGSPLLAAIAYLGGFLPQALGALTLLSLADRLPPRAAMVGWRLVHAALIATFAAGVLPVGAMLALIMLAGLGDAVVAAVNGAVVVDVLPDGAYVLGRSALNISTGAMQIAGFAGGGTLLALVGPHGAFWAAAGLGAAGAVILRLGMRRRTPRRVERASVAETWCGNRVLLGRRRLRNLLLAQWLPNGLIVGAEAMFVPYAGDAAGALFLAAAAGMLAGDLVIGRWTAPARRAALGLPLYALLAVPYLAFPLRPGVAWAGVLVAVASFGYAATLTVQERFVAAVPGDLLAQGLGLAGSGMLTVQAVAAAGVGVVAELATPAAAITVAALGSLLSTVLLFRRAGDLRPGEVARPTARDQRADGSGACRRSRPAPAGGPGRGWRWRPGR
ncbi:Predicted arabinose efflux permease, MFS family [Paractinoplanes atraurantiacus]|uniref:Predicted arabinose efflux permease, MFS family n=1 Tax=Paractinoplanes atraurantiacus TaxID=1036182 RepID=A0A285ILU6_9ACTN|nr:Predicted arabinose efflux permease, MFS family [Actinoplanes atraurantiacus]